ncbi:hypothetical protein J2125_000105 [Erwinia toletana]|uniref:DUF1496 domain-containing protein n=1 Tax=Winslowiella toletana TaxID=92490 RepID=A0ABS4P2M4_9GAMM|nr:DUF1496 domain-containing protein [Winslowiella toletana]MBP2166913.1 hypothetical protein [Winslowiella toletana]
MKLSAVLLCAGWLLSSAALAQGQSQEYGSNHARPGGNTDVVVDLPPEVWTQGNSNQQNQPCARCCTYGNQNYSEGSVIKQEGVLLQCARDKASLGTNNLIWQMIKQ